MIRYVGLTLMLTLGLVHAQDTSGAEGGASPSETANLVGTAEITDAQGNVIGDANFTTGVNDSSFVTVQIGLSEGSGLEPGEHGVHIHEVGECSAPDFESAGAHYNPTGAQHGPHPATTPRPPDRPRRRCHGQ